MASRCTNRRMSMLFAWRTLILFAWLPLAVFLQVAFPSLGKAQTSESSTPASSVEVVPSAVEVASKREATAYVIVSNTSTKTFRNVRLSPFTNAGVEATVVGRSEVDELAPEAEHAWELRVTQTENGPATGTVHLRVDYEWVKEDESGVISQTVFGSLETKNRAPTTVDAVAEAQVRTTLGTLSGERPGKTFLTVRNKSDVPLRITDLSLTVPEDIVTYDCDKTEFIDPNCQIGPDGMPIAPNENRTIEINLRAKNRITPGKYLVLFEIPMEWGWPGTEQSGELVTSHEVSAEVFGESQILTLLGVPLLLALPGFLVVGTWSILWALYPLKPKDEMPAFPVSFGTAGFWIVSLTVSIFLIFFYSLLFRTNYLRSYGLWDMVLLWLVSVLLGGATYFFLKRRVGRYRSKRIPTEQDEPILVLRKLRQQDLGIKLDRVKVEVDGKPHKLFLLEPNREDQKMISVSPYMVVRWRPVNEDQLERQRQLRNDVRESLIKQRDPNGLARLLEQGKASGFLEVIWDPSKGPGRPLRLKKEEIKDWSVEPDIIVVTD